MLCFDWLLQLRHQVRSNRGRRRARTAPQRHTFRPGVRRLEERTLLSTMPLQVFNTGVDNTGKLLADGATDQHYLLKAAPSGDTPGPANVVLQNGSPFGYWSADGPSSKWVAPHANEHNLKEPGGSYTYETTFSLANFDPSTATLAVQVSGDDTVQQILLNGHDTGFVPQGSSNYSSFLSVTVGSGFQAGSNKLDFVLNNTSTGTTNASGLRVQLSGSANFLGSAVPVFNTGVGPTGTVLADGATDPHYQLVATPSSSQPSTAFVVQQNGYPVGNPWFADGPSSKLSPFPKCLPSFDLK